jgi:hypothetical protein
MAKIILCTKCAKRMRAELRIAAAHPEHRYYFSCECGAYRVVSEDDYALYVRVEQWKGHSVIVRDLNPSQGRRGLAGRV